MKELYKVTATFQYVIASDAENAANLNYDAHCHFLSAANDVFESDVKYSIEPYTEDCVDGWYNDCYPYGSFEPISNFLNKE